MLDVCKLTDDVPVPTRLCPRILLSPDMSSDHACIMLPPRAPAVITTRCVPQGPCVTRRELEPGVVIDAAANDDVSEAVIFIDRAD